MKKKLLALSVLAVVSSQVHAFEFDTPDDWSIRWDNTFKYNLLVRTASQDKDVYQAAGALGLAAADPDLSRDKGDIVSNRVDLLSELDVIWKETMGFRVSVAAWYDHGYRRDMDQPDSLANHWTNPSVGVGELASEAEDLHYKGGELLDAFAFVNFDVGDVAANIRAGRHTIYWGQSLLLTGAVHSVGGAMNSIDVLKGVSVPGSEAKELFRPTNKLSTVVQWTENLTMEAYYGLEWENYRLPEATTFFSPADLLTEDTEVLHLAPGLGIQVNDDESSDDEWGINFSYYFDNSALEVSAYYLNYSSKVQDGVVGVLDFGQALGIGLFDGTPLEPFKPIFGAPPDLISAELGQVGIGNYKWVYKDDVDLYGISLAKEIAGISVGMDFSYRKNAPLRPDFLPSLQRFGNYPALPPALLEQLVAIIGPEVDINDVDESTYETYFATGDTFHLVVNGLGLLSDNGIWQGGAYIVEATFSYLDKVHQNDHLVMGTNGGPVRVKSRLGSHIGVVFNPAWYQVFPGVDVTLKTNVGIGINNSSPIGFGGDEEVGSGGLGVEFNVEQIWTADLKYNFFFGPAVNGVGGLWKDRDNVSLTLKRTF